MKKPYLDRIKDSPLVFDGAMGTMLYTKGITLNRCFEELNLSSPDIIAEIHREFIAAGAEAIETNSFGANRMKLATHGIEDKTVEINKAAVRIARKAAGADTFIAGSVGPLGAYIEPFGRISVAEAADAFREQIAALVSEGVDCILLETFKNIDELLLAARVCREIDPKVPVQAQFTLGEGLTGELDKTASLWASMLEKSDDVDIVGFNCSIGPADLLDVLIAIRDKVDKPISVMPNAGYPKEVDGRLIYLSSPEYFAAFSRRFIDSGASVVGGCCGTTPEHIREISQGIGSRRVMRTSKIASVNEEVKEKQEVPLAERSRLGHLVANGKWVTLVELLPPMGTSLVETVEKSAALYRSGVDAINIPDGPRASARISGIMAAMEIEGKAKIETVIHYCCRDRNLIGMQSDLLGAYAMGIRNILIVTGDPPKLGGYPNATGVFDVDSVGLTTLVTRLNKGIDFGGNEMAAPTSFVAGVGANPGSLSFDYEIDRTFKKVEAGAAFIITQPVFDPEILIRFLDRLAGIDVPVIAGVWPLASYKNAQFLQNEVPEVNIPETIMEKMRKTGTKEEGIAMGIEIAREIVAAVRHRISGVQISPPFGRVSTARTLLDAIDRQ